ncbi:hypothetical protein [Nocardia brasiliensis]|nr:hypothetical protein [Nocardia brasiliensis]
MPKLFDYDAESRRHNEHLRVLETHHTETDVYICSRAWIVTARRGR